MSKVFYDQLVVIEDIYQELDNHLLSDDERTELKNLADQHLHHHILTVILNHLPAHHHPFFLENLLKGPNDAKLLSFLKKEIKADIESVIKSEAAKIKKDILSEISKAKNK
jgi:hypothetical protein